MGRYCRYVFTGFGHETGVVVEVWYKCKIWQILMQAKRTRPKKKMKSLNQAEKAIVHRVIMDWTRI